MNQLEEEFIAKHCKYSKKKPRKRNQKRERKRERAERKERKPVKEKEKEDFNPVIPAPANKNENVKKSEEKRWQKEKG